MDRGEGDGHWQEEKRPNNKELARLVPLYAWSQCHAQGRLLTKLRINPKSWKSVEVRTAHKNV